MALEAIKDTDKTLVPVLQDATSKGILVHVASATGSTTIISATAHSTTGTTTAATADLALTGTVVYISLMNTAAIGGNSLSFAFSASESFVTLAPQASWDGFCTNGTIKIKDTVGASHATYALIYTSY
jgi:hypothetical protein